jgi:hypothetical protein
MKKSSKPVQKYDVNIVLQNSCAAFRINGGYTNIHKYNPTHLIKNNIGAVLYDHVPKFEILPEDIELANTIRQHFKRLIFSIIGSNSNNYESSIFLLFEQEYIPSTKFQLLAELPEYYVVNKAFTDINKKIKECDSVHNYKKYDIISNTKCEIVHVMKTKNFSGYNITAIVNNNVVSWYSENIISVGDYVLISAQVKDHGWHYYAECSDIRLTKVKLQ